ncbi:MAG: hypothetical protein H6853_07665 [Rhodospirillales bacterium]|nr:hypothetical protein [Alphaproteobacteria bacterium]USO03397.1 MAG: hypothetical protein H6853_07665 [Rhodospirillales bacterium]
MTKLAPKIFFAAAATAAALSPNAFAADPDTAPSPPESFPLKELFQDLQEALPELGAGTRYLESLLNSPGFGRMIEELRQRECEIAPKILEILESEKPEEDKKADLRTLNNGILTEKKIAKIIKIKPEELREDIKTACPQKAPPAQNIRQYKI